LLSLAHTLFVCCSSEIESGRRGDLGIGEGEPILALQNAGEGSDQGHLQPIEEPGCPERNDDAGMPAAPRKAIEAARYVCFYYLILRDSIL
jgi:hypothetical protein